ncbi:MAG: hypothetical protein ACE14P_12210 [Methanotrichaceae archaeon]
MGETMVGEVDSRGRVQLSRALREVLDIHPGDKVRITVEKIAMPKVDAAERER